MQVIYIYMQVIYIYIYASYIYIYMQVIYIYMKVIYIYIQSLALSLSIYIHTSCDSESYLPLPHLIPEGKLKPCSGSNLVVSY